MESEKVKEIKEYLRCMRGEKACWDCGLNEIAENQDTCCINLVADMALDLINELESENERLSKEKEDLRLFDIALGNGKVDMTLGGNTAKSFINAIVQIFEQNNATNFLATTIETISSGNKYSLVIQKENGQTPSEKLVELKDRIAELENENAKLLDSVETVQNNRCTTKCELTKKALIQFGKKFELNIGKYLKKKYSDYQQDSFYYIVDKADVDMCLDETLKEFIND